MGITSHGLAIRVTTYVWTWGCGVLRPNVAAVEHGGAADVMIYGWANAEPGTGDLVVCPVVALVFTAPAPRTGP